MNKIIVLLFLTSIFFSCQETPDDSVIEDKITEELKSGDDIGNLFLNLKFGISKKEFDDYLINQKDSGKVKITYTGGYSYEFTDNNELEGIDWFITPKLHNDTIIGVKLHSFKSLWKNNNNSIDQTYNIILKEYQNKYGTPSYSAGRFTNYWFKKNLEIVITKSDDDDVLGGSVYISYEDTRKRREIDLGKCRFDERANSLDSWYYERLQKEKEEEEEKINNDI